MAAETTHVTTHFYSIAWTTMAANIDLVVACTYMACDTRFLLKNVSGQFWRPFSTDVFQNRLKLRRCGYKTELPQSKQCPSLTGSSIAASPSSNPGSSSPTPGSSRSGCPGSESSSDSSVSPLPNSAMALFRRYRRASLPNLGLQAPAHTRGGGGVVSGPVKTKYRREKKTPLSKVKMVSGE